MSAPAWTNSSSSSERATPMDAMLPAFAARTPADRVLHDDGILGRCCQRVGCREEHVGVGLTTRKGTTRHVGVEDAAQREPDLTEIVEPDLGEQEVRVLRGRHG